MKFIELTQGFFAIIDDDDYDRISKYNWSVRNKKIERTQYAQTCLTSYPKFTSISLHRFILDAKKNQIIDHVNGNGLDNRKINLRFCTKQQNSRNSKTPKHSTSGYKGVHFCKQKQSWIAKIGTESNKRLHLGTFSTKEEAAEAYNKAALQYFKEFARLNVIKA